jgi:hypothetical protein
MIQYMVIGSSQEWFLEVGGKKTGPFSAEQVLGLLQEKEIPETQRITSDSLEGKWVTALEFSKMHAAGLLPTKPFNPPPRPIEQVLPPGTLEIPHEIPTDPALGLFDALQAAKERKQSRFKRLRPRSRARDGEDGPVNEAPLIPNNAWLLAVLGLALLGGAWGMSHFIKQKTTESTGSLEAAHPVHPSPTNVNPVPAGTVTAHNPPPIGAPHTVTVPPVQKAGMPTSAAAVRFPPPVFNPPPAAPNVPERDAPQADTRNYDLNPEPPIPPPPPPLTNPPPPIPENFGDQNGPNGMNGATNGDVPPPPPPME